MVLLARPKAKTLTGAATALIMLGALAWAEEPSPAAIELASKILGDVGFKQSVDLILPSMLGELERNIVAVHPEMKEALHETLVAIEPEFAKSESGVLTDVAHVLASRLSEKELKETAAFFESAAGRTYVAAEPAMLEELKVSGTTWRQQLSNEMLTRVREEMTKKGFHL